MNIKDAYIHNGEAILKDIQVSGSKLQKLKAGKNTTTDAYLTWEDVLDFSSFGASGHNHDDRYLKLSGGTLTGALNFKYGTNNGDQLIKFESTDTTDSQAVYFGIRRPADTYGLSYKDTAGTFHKVYHDGNLTIATLVGATAIGDSDEPIYWNGSAFVKAGAYPTKSSWNYDDVYLKDLGLDTGNSTNKNVSTSLTNGNVYLKLFKTVNGAEAEDSKVKIYGASNVSVTTDASGDIKITGVDSVTTATYASNVGAAGTAGTNYVTAANVISMYNWYSGITATDEASNTAIDKWNEIVSFLAGIADTSTLSGILAGYAASGHNHDDVYANKYSYSLPPQKCVKITYTAQNPVIISAGRSNGSSEFVLIGLGYGGDAWTRNQFRCLIPSNNFTWRLSADSCTVEVYHNFSGDGNAVVKVISTGSVTFTQTDALSGDADTKRFACYDELTWANIANKPDTATSYGYIGTTQVQASSAQQNLTGIGDSTFSGVMNITGRQSYAEGIRIHDYSGISSIWFRAVNADNYDAGMIGITGSSTGLRFRLPASATGTSPTDYVTIAYGGATTVAGTFTASNKVYFTGLGEGTSDVTADTEILTSYAGTSGFANTTGAGQVYRRQASKLYNYIKTAASGDWAINSAKVKTIKSTTNATYYLTFVDSNNTTATAETIYTSANITFNPTTSNLAITTASGQNMAFKEVRTGGASVSMGVGSGNKNHGVYSNSLSKWLIYADSSDTTNKKVYVNNTSIPESATLLTTSNYGTTLNSVYVRTNPGAAEQTIESSIGTYAKGIVEFYRSSGDHICFINFANKQSNTKTTLGAIGFRNSSYSGPYYLKDSNYYPLYHSGNLTPATLTLSTTAQTFITAGSTTYTLKLPTTSPYSYSFDDLTSHPTTLDGYGITGGILSSNLTLKSTSGDSPQLIFQRGTLTDTLDDWRILDTGGNLKFQHTTGSTTDWKDYVVFSATAGTVNINGNAVWHAGNFTPSDYRNNIVDLRTNPQTFNPSYLKDIVFISEADYTTLVSNGSITKNSITHTYNASNWYVIEDKVPEYAENAGNADYASIAGRANSADYADEVDWSGITNKPLTATRWPSWTEVTSKPTWVTWEETSSTASYSLSNNTWTESITLPTTAGSYVIKLVSGNSTLTGLFSIGASDNVKDEITLHLHGNGPRLYARTNGTKLQLSSNATSATSTSVTITYRRII